MTSVGPVEAFWVALNSATLLLTLGLLVDAERDRRYVRRFNGHAREIVTLNVVRREVMRAIVQGILLALAVPALLDDRQVTLSPLVVGFIAIALILFAQSLFDTRERKQLAAIVAREYGAPSPPPGSTAL
jgi:hypothetical protein